MRPSLFILILIVLAGIVIVPGLLHMWRYVRIGKVLAAQAVAYQQVGQPGGPRILIVGDSSSVGVGSDPTQSVAGRLGAEFPTASIQNYSRSGRKTAEAATVVQSFAGQSFDLVLIHTGGNDTLRFTPVGPLRESVRATIAAAKTLSPNVVIVSTGNLGLAPFFPWYLQPFWSWRTRVVRSIFLEETAAAGVAYVDLYVERNTDPYLRDIPKFYAADRLHLTGEGYGIWYTAIRATLAAANIQLGTHEE